MAVVAALAAGSVALLGFGIDSFVECVSGGVMIWRLRAEQAGASEQKLERTEHTARKGVAAALALLACYVVIDAVGTLWKREHPRPSAVGVTLTALSLGVMWWLAREKRRVAAAIGSRAMEADAFQTTACWWLSLATLVGMALNGALGWWWADPVAGLVVAVLVASEARDAWRGDDCC
ncbi:MAG: cation transporter [Polyangiaceae bacterium]|nr:cation transporter [Polyangiaceae bacterium]